MSQNTFSRNTALPVDYLTTDEADSDSEISFDRQRFFYRRSNKTSPASSTGLSYRSANRHSPDADKRHSVTDKQRRQHSSNRDADAGNGTNLRQNCDNRKQICLQQVAGNLFEKLSKLLGIDKLHTTAYRGQSNPYIECWHKWLNSLMAKYLDKSHRETGRIN